MLGKWLGDHFLEIQFWFLLIAVAYGAFRLFSRDHAKSGFKVREADLHQPKKKPKGTDDLLANAKLRRRDPPAALPGLSLDGPPHQILGVNADASTEEVQRAYRDLMKRYHPDQVGRPGSREWKDAQHIAAALTEAKNTLLQRKKDGQRTPS